jgi:hypothetical protein
MKKTNIKLWAGALLVLLTVSSCEDKLNINDNPNQPITADIDLVLPQAITASASIASQFNSYGGHFGGYIANAGGFSGFGNLLNYNLTPGDYNGLWVNTYQDPLKDLKYVIDNTEGQGQYAYYNASAKIMTAFLYQKLVDTFGNIPYSQALRGEEGMVAPAYDDAATIYQDLFTKLQESIELIEAANNSTTVLPLSLTSASDPLFTDPEFDTAEEQATAWARFANTLKLKILMRLTEKTEFNSFVTTGFANLDLGLGFLTNDAIVDPGYELNRPNPAWATWGRGVALALSNSSRIPTTYSFGFFNGNKLQDTRRGEANFVAYPGTPTNQLGNEVGNPTIVAGQVTWASNQSGYAGTGILKGAAMGQPLMLHAEALFLLAEAQLRGFIGAMPAPWLAYTDYITTFNAGVDASFGYTFKNENEATVTPPGLIVGAGQTVAQALGNEYRGANAGNRRADITLATTFDQRLEAIITQKYVAMTMVTSDEAYNEFRRTGYPVTVPGGSAVTDIASNKSNVTSRPDRLPTRVLYPSSEQSYNATNYVAIDHKVNLIFWDPN